MVLKTHRSVRVNMWAKFPQKKKKKKKKSEGRFFDNLSRDEKSGV